MLAICVSCFHAAFSFVIFAFSSLLPSFFHCMKPDGFEKVELIMKVMECLIVYYLGVVFLLVIEWADMLTLYDFNWLIVFISIEKCFLSYA